MITDKKIYITTGMQIIDNFKTKTDDVKWEIDNSLELIKNILKNQKSYETIVKNLPAPRAHSHCALGAQLASLASLSAPRARDSIVALRAPEFLNVALCAPFFLDLALRARSCALRIRLSLFLII